MLKRTALRRYLMALLYADDVPQDADCGIGNLWTNCDGERVIPLDHETRQIFEDGEKSYQLNTKDAAIVFYFQTVRYKLSATKMEGADIVLLVDIVANAAGAEARQYIIDEIEERFWFRLFSFASFHNEETGELLRSPMHWLTNNGVTAETADDSNFAGRYTIRTIRLTFSTNAECVKKLDCTDLPLCFDWDEIPDFGNGC